MPIEVGGSVTRFLTRNPPDFFRALESFSGWESEQCGQDVSSYVSAFKNGSFWALQSK